MSAENEHKANAEKLIDDVDDILDEASRELFSERQGALALIEATRAQALATLYAADQTAALVEQKRIGNLISLIGLQESLGTKVALSDGFLYRHVKQGLGL